MHPKHIAGSLAGEPGLPGRPAFALYRKKKPKLVDLWSRSGLPGKLIKEGEGLRPPPFLMGFTEAGGRFDLQNSSDLCFYVSAPFGVAPFYGYPIASCCSVSGINSSRRTFKTR